jgi:hypothetical protein
LLDKRKCRAICAAFCFLFSGLFLRDHEPQQKVNQQSRNPAWGRGKKDPDAEPPGADPKELSQPAANARNDTIRA